MMFIQLQDALYVESKSQHSQWPSGLVKPTHIFSVVYDSIREDFQGQIGDLLHACVGLATVVAEAGDSPHRT